MAKSTVQNPLLWWLFVALLSCQVWSHESICGSSGSKAACLAEVQRYFGSTEWWFGDSFSTDCPGVTPGDNATTFKCLNPSPYRSIGSRLLQREDFDVDTIEQVLRIRYFAPAGSYVACGHRFNVPETLMHKDVESDHVIYLDSWSLRGRPAVIWEGSPNTVYTLAVYDVGQMELCGLWVNIRGSDSALGEEIVPYRSLKNPIYRDSFLVFAVFVQMGIIPASDRQRATFNYWMSPPHHDLLTDTFQDLGGKVIQDPIAVGYVSLYPDPYSIQSFKDMSRFNNCPYLAARQPLVMKVMNAFDITQRFSTAEDFSTTYFDELEVQLEVTYWSEAVAYNVCCSLQEEAEQLVTVDFLGQPLGSIHVRNSPMILLSPVQSMDKTFFIGKFFTLLLLDITDVENDVTNPVTPLLWMVTDHKGASSPGPGYTQRNYTAPTLELGETRSYVFLAFRQQSSMGASFSLLDYCNNGTVENCNLDLNGLVTSNNFQFSGVNLFKAQADMYTRWSMLEEHPENKATICRGVRGYGNPCPSRVCPPTPSTQRPTRAPGTTRRPTGPRDAGTSISSAQTLILLASILALSARWLMTESD